MLKRFLLILFLLIFSMSIANAYENYGKFGGQSISTITWTIDKRNNGAFEISNPTSSIHLKFSTNAVISTETKEYIEISSNVYINGYSSVTYYYGDGSNLTAVDADNLGGTVAADYATDSEVATATTSVKTYFEDSIFTPTMYYVHTDSACSTYDIYLQSATATSDWVFVSSFAITATRVSSGTLSGINIDYLDWCGFGFANTDSVNPAGGVMLSLIQESPYKYMSWGYSGDVYDSTGVFTNNDVGTWGKQYLR